MSTTTPAVKPELLTVTEAAEYLTISRKSVETMIASGTLRAIDVATRNGAKRKAWRLRRQDLDTFLRSRQQRPITAAA